MLHGVSGARFTYFTFPRLGSYFLMPCQLWHVQQYSLVALVSVIVRSFHTHHSNIRANKKQGLKTHHLQPLTVQILTDCAKIGFPLREINKPTSPDRCKSRAARSRHKNRLAKRNRIARQAVRLVPDRLSKHRSQSCACAHAASCDRFAAQSLRSFGQPDAFGAGASFAPIPAPVKLAEPKYALRPSMMIHLKCTRGHSIRSMPIHNSG